MPLSDDSIRRLKPAQRDLLVDHIDGSVQLSVSRLVQTRASLLKAGLLRGHPSHAARPPETVLTEAGRRAVGVILGDCADALVRAGLLAQENPLQVLAQLRAARSALSSAVPDRQPWKSALRKPNL